MVKRDEMKTGELRNSNSYALITGASEGIGKAISIECATRGINLVMVALHGSGLGRVAEDISERWGVETFCFETDLCKEGAHNALGEFIQQKNLGVNILVNNVGVGYNGNLTALTERNVVEMLILNMLNTTLLTRMLVPGMLSYERSYILNIGSMAGFCPLPGKSVYAASKAYILFFSKAVRHELKGTSITVSAIFPAGVPTNIVVQDRIKRSGRIAKKIVVSPEQVAREAVNGMFKGRAVIFPGLRVKSFFFTCSLMPQGMVIRLAEREFRKSVHHS